MFQTFISRHNSNFFSDKLVLTSVTPASSAPVLQTPKRSEERFSRNAETDLVCRLLLEKKNRNSATPWGLSQGLLARSARSCNTERLSLRGEPSLCTRLRAGS